MLSRCFTYGDALYGAAGTTGGRSVALRHPTTGRRNTCSCGGGLGEWGKGGLPLPNPQTGRQSPELIDGAHYVEEADLVVKALGFEPEDLPALWGVDGLEVTRWGTVKADFTTGQTSLDGVFAAGDIVRGASLVVWAIKDGRDCATSIMDYLSQSGAVAAE